MAYGYENGARCNTCQGDIIPPECDATVWDEHNLYEHLHPVWKCCLRRCGNCCGLLCEGETDAGNEWGGGCWHRGCCEQNLCA